MRHKVDRRKLNRKGAHLRSMLANMAISLIEHESVKTTLPKALELRRYIEPLVTIARKQTLDARRRILSKLHQQAKPTSKLMDDLAKRFAQRPGGYVRILKMQVRTGDVAPMAVIQFVDYEDLLKKREEERLLAEKGEKAPKAVKEKSDSVEEDSEK